MQRRRHLLLMVMAALLSGCATTVNASALRTSRLPNLAPAGPFTLGADTLTLLRGGEATFTALNGLLSGATREIDVEMYEFGRPDLADDLVAAHRRGVAVHVIVDPTVDVSAVTESHLRAAGVSVVDYPVRSLMIDHVKLLVVDGTVGVVGGVNWGVASWANHDFDAEVRGPVVTNLLSVFRRDLVTCGIAAMIPTPVDDPALLVATTLPSDDIHPLAIDVIDSARTRLDLALFVITDTPIVHALERAAERGVSVRVLLDPSQRSSDPSAAALRNAGISLRMYASAGELLHAKVVVADDETVLFGSANWSSGGFVRNHEVDVKIPHAPLVARAFEEQIEADWAGS